MTKKIRYIKVTYNHCNVIVQKEHVILSFVAFPFFWGYLFVQNKILNRNELIDKKSTDRNYA